MSDVLQFLSINVQPRFKPTNDTPTFDNMTSSSNPLSTIQFSVESVAKQLKIVDDKKNGGPDGIPNVFLKMTHDSLAIPLTMLFNRSLEEGTFPYRFKQAFVTAIHKGGKNSEITNYRPVCLLNAFSKVFERLVHDIVYEFFLPLLDLNQHEFV